MVSIAAKAKNAETAIMMRLSLHSAQRSSLRAWDASEKMSRGNSEVIPDILGVWIAYGRKGTDSLAYLSMAANLRHADGRLMARLARAVSPGGFLQEEFEGFMHAHSRILSVYAAENVAQYAHILIGEFLERDVGPIKRE